MLRAVVTSSFLLLAVVVLWMAFVVGTDTSYGTLFINLGTEIIGIVITVAVVEWFFERRRLLTRGRQLAWDSLHATQTAVWVWQGGPREMETDELLGHRVEILYRHGTALLLSGEPPFQVGHLPVQPPKSLHERLDAAGPQ